MIIENKWKRYNNTNFLIQYNDMILKSNIINANNNDLHVGYTNNSYFKFNFIGSSFRLIGTKKSTNSNNIEIKIDDVVINIDGYSDVELYNEVIFEKNNLPFRNHTVQVSNKVNLLEINIDSIDIEINGWLAHEKEIIKFEDAKLNDLIRCHYKNTVKSSTGKFFNLATDYYKDGINEFIPFELDNTGTVNGAFFLKVCKNKNNQLTLIPDRPIQNNISWNTLRDNGFLFDKFINFNLYSLLNDGISESSSSFTDNSQERPFNNIVGDFWSTQKTNTTVIGEWIKYTLTSPKEIDTIEFNQEVYDNSVSKVKLFIKKFGSLEEEYIASFNLTEFNTIDIPLTKIVSIRFEAEADTNRPNLEWIVHDIKAFNSNHSLYTIKSRLPKFTTTGNNEITNYFDDKIVISDNFPDKTKQYTIWTSSRESLLYTTKVMLLRIGKVSTSSSDYPEIITSTIHLYPIFEISIDKDIKNSFLFKKNGVLYTFKNNSWTVVNENFLDNSIKDLSILYVPNVNDIKPIDFLGQNFTICTLSNINNDDSKVEIKYLSPSQIIQFKRNMYTNINDNLIIDSILINSNSLKGSPLIKTLITFNNGQSWFGIDLNGKTIEIKNPSKQDYISYGYTIEQLKNLNQFDILDIIRKSNYYKNNTFALSIYLEETNPTDKITIESIDIIFAKEHGNFKNLEQGIEYDYKYTNFKNLEVSFYKEGKFKVNYYENNNPPKNDNLNNKLEWSEFDLL